MQTYSRAARCAAADEICAMVAALQSEPVAAI
jgi:hypothetical protein